MSAKKIAPHLMSIAALAAALVQSAQAEPIVSERAVAYADLDLTQQSDAREVVRRVRWAAFRACGGVSEIWATGRDRTQLKRCSAAAVAEAVAALDAPEVQRAHEQGHAARAQTRASN